MLDLGQLLHDFHMYHSMHPSKLLCYSISL